MTQASALTTARWNVRGLANKKGGLETLSASRNVGVFMLNEPVYFPLEIKGVSIKHFELAASFERKNSPAFKSKNSGGGACISIR